MTRTCTVCKREFETTNEKLSVCFGCINDESRQAYEDAEDERLWSEAFHQERAEQEDNELPSGSTNLGNRGGTTFCY